MAEYPNTPEDLYPFAKAMVLSLNRKKELKWKRHRIEDAIQELFLAGWQVYSDTGNVGFAKNRMRDRRENLLRDYGYEVEHEPESESQRFSAEGVRGDEDDVRKWDDPTKRSELRADQHAESAVRDIIEQMTERQQAIVKLRMAAFTNEEIAEELGISLRTVERELSQLRKDYANDE